MGQAAQWWWKWPLVVVEVSSSPQKAFPVSADTGRHWPVPSSLQTAVACLSAACP